MKLPARWLLATISIALITGCGSSSDGPATGTDIDTCGCNMAVAFSYCTSTEFDPDAVAAYRDDSCLNDHYSNCVNAELSAPDGYFVNDSCPTAGASGRCEYPDGDGFLETKTWIVYSTGDRGAMFDTIAEVDDAGTDCAGTFTNLLE